MTAPKFRLHQIGMREGTWRGLEMGEHMEGGEEYSGLNDPLIVRVIGEEVNYGKLFAYCLRRFGYPEAGWDDYKDLVGYTLATPHPQLVLRICPSVDDIASLSLRFLVEQATLKEVALYSSRDRLAWVTRSLEWAEAQGLPDWMGEWLDFYNTEMRVLYPSIPHANSWREAGKGVWGAVGKQGTRLYDMTQKVSRFWRQLQTSYTAVEAMPGPYMRPAAISAWADEDPLKPLALAALAALEDLKTPVNAGRYETINALGVVDDAGPLQPYAKSAGCPSGALGNQSPQRTVALHRAVFKVGEGDPVKGMHRMLDLLKTP